MNDDWRLAVRLKSRRELREYMQFHKVSGRELAKRAGLSQGTVNHLVRGGTTGRNTCSLATAKAIEEALQCPPGFLFEPSLSRVADVTRRGAA